MSTVRPLTGRIQPYAWGSTTAIAAIRGVEPDGGPQAELWLGAHPGAPSEVDGQTLPEVIAADPGQLGGATVRAFGPQLPYLLKILAADRALSLQAHPSRDQAEAGYAAERAAGVATDDPHRNYADDWPKPEMLCALGDFEALYGFADPLLVADQLADLRVPELDALIAPLRGNDAAGGIREVFVACCRLSGDERAVVTTVAEAAAAVVTDDEALAARCRTAVELAEQYPGDPGVIAALLMNRVRLRADEAVELPAGNMHAYLRGTGVEIMAASDNVLRGGLTPKHVDVDELARIVDFSPVVPAIVTATEDDPGVFRYPVQAPEFALWRLELGPHVEVGIPGDHSGRILLITAGTAEIDGHAMTSGESVWIGADAGPLTVSGSGTAFLAAPGTRR